MTISVGRSLKRKTMLVWVKEYINKNFATCKNLCNLQELYTAFKEKAPKFKYWVLNVLCLETQMVFWLAQKWLTLFEFVVLIKNAVLLVNAMDWDLAYKDLIKLFLALSISIKIYLQSLLYHHHLQEHFSNWNITSSPYVEMLLISMIKLLFFFSVIAIFDVVSCNL